MSIRDQLSQACDESFTWVDFLLENGEESPFDAEIESGAHTTLELLPGLSSGGLQTLEASLPAPMPLDIKELLAFTAGFNIGTDEVRFTSFNQWGYEFLLPDVMVLNGDGRGNAWAIEVNPSTGAWRHVWFVCHDPPVLIYQCETLDDFIAGVLDQYRLERCQAGHRSFLSEVDNLTLAVWRKRRDQPKAAHLADADDVTLRNFAQSLGRYARVADLRSAALGDGFDWSPLNDERRPVRRAGTELLFGIEPKRTLLRRLFGGSLT